tara:strand:- start:601 stop:792 length:192 start_codon:yes stop_codon:yes gene_type:complete
MTKYILIYKENGHQEKRRVELEEGADIMTFITNDLPKQSRLLMKKVEEFNEDDLCYPLLGESK